MSLCSTVPPPPPPAARPCLRSTMGLTADLTAGEIVEQLVHACAVSRIRNIVFMVGA